MMRGKLLLAIAGGLTALLGLWVMYQEAAPNFRGGSTAIARIAAMPDAGAPIGLTTLSQRRTLLDCEQVFRSSSSLEMQYLGVQERQDIEQRCGQIAQRVATRNPANSLAWALEAAADGAAGDADAFSTALIRSTISGRNELAIADLRVDHAERNLALLSPEATTLHEQDLALLAGDQNQAPALAQRYIADADFKQRMDTILPTMTPEGQQTFVFAVRSILAASGR